MIGTSRTRAAGSTRPPAKPGAATTLTKARQQRARRPPPRPRRRAHLARARPRSSACTGAEAARPACRRPWAISCRRRPAMSTSSPALRTPAACGSETRPAARTSRRQTRTGTPSRSRRWTRSSRRRARSQGCSATLRAPRTSPPTSPTRPPAPSDSPCSSVDATAAHRAHHPHCAPCLCALLRQGTLCGTGGYLPTTHLGIIARITARSPLAVPAFVFIGEQDGIISPAMSEEAAAAYSSAAVSRSPSAGHHLPYSSDPAFQEALDFLEQELAQDPQPPLDSAGAPRHRRDGHSLALLLLPSSLTLFFMLPPCQALPQRRRRRPPLPSRRRAR